MATFSQTPTPPYYAVIFTSTLRATTRGYEEMSVRMMELAERQPGFLGAESARDPAGFGITVSYWESHEAIARWKADTAHRFAQELGKREWYERYQLHIAKVERTYGSAGGLAGPTRPEADTDGSGIA